MMKTIPRAFATVLFLIMTAAAMPQDSDLPGTIREMQRNVCAIKVHAHSGKDGLGTPVGCGVVLMSKVDGQKVYFVATANHIIEQLYTGDGAYAEVMAFDREGIMLKTSAVNKGHVIWRNRELDAALFILPRELEPQGQVPAGYANPGPSNLKVIGDPQWGEDVYLFGYRWMSDDLFIDILKKGILSVGTTELPGYKGHLVYLIDNMANKGMSGGLAFAKDGSGIGIISSYVYEADTRFRNSDDLTVCLPLTFYFQALEEVLASDRDRLIRFLDQ